MILTACPPDMSVYLVSPGAHTAALRGVAFLAHMLTRTPERMFALRLQ